MAGVITTRGAAIIAKLAMQAATSPLVFYVAATTNNCSKTTNLLSELTQLAAQYGYPNGGYQVVRTIGDISIVEDDGNSYAEITFKNIVFAAVNGAIPYPSFLILTTDEQNVSDRQVIGSWDMGAGAVIADGTTLTAAALKMRIPV